MGVVVIANGLLAYLAVDTWSGLETEDHYRKGLAYNQNLAAAEAQAERGWSMALDYAPAAAGRDGSLSVTFRDRDDRPLVDLNVRAALVRPTHGGYDLEVALTHLGDGLYRAVLTPPLPGQWQARIHARRRDETFQISRRIVVP